MITTMKGKAQIQYPCTWRYKVFGTDEGLMREAVTRIITDGEYTLTHSHSSSHKKYLSMNLDIMVMNEEDRLGIYQALIGHEAIIFVL